MANPPGTYVISSSDRTGAATVTINYDPASPTKALRNVGTPGRCLLADNGMSHPVPYYVKTPQGLFTGQLPTGHTDATVNQIVASSGITALQDIEMGFGPYIPV